MTSCSCRTSPTPPPEKSRRPSCASAFATTCCPAPASDIRRRRTEALLGGSLGVLPLPACGERVGVRATLTEPERAERPPHPDRSRDPTFPACGERWRQARGAPHCRHPGLALFVAYAALCHPTVDLGHGSPSYRRRASLEICDLG